MTYELYLALLEWMGWEGKKEGKKEGKREDEIVGKRVVRSEGKRE